MPTTKTYYLLDLFVVEMMEKLRQKRGVRCGASRERVTGSSSSSSSDFRSARVLASRRLTLSWDARPARPVYPSRLCLSKRNRRGRTGAGKEEEEEEEETCFRRNVALRCSFRSSSSDRAEENTGGACAGGGGSYGNEERRISNIFTSTSTPTSSSSSPSRNGTSTSNGKQRRVVKFLVEENEGHHFGKGQSHAGSKEDSGGSGLKKETAAGVVPPSPPPPPSSMYSILDGISEDNDNKMTLFSAACMSFMWSMGSFMVLSLLPVYLREHLGLSNTKIGALEGFAVVASALAKGLSGVMSDLIGSRKLIVLLGSSVTLLIKPLFALSPLILTKYGPQVALATVSVGKIVDRLGKGLRAAPFDALISDVSPVSKRGRAYGLNYSATTLGAVCGCLIASLLMKVTGNSYSISLAVAIVPPLAATLILWRFVTEGKGGDAGAGEGAGEGESSQEHLANKDTATTSVAHELVVENKMTTVERFRFLTSAVKDLPIRFWQSLLIVCVLYLARFSESFMTIRARSVGMSVSKLPLLLIVDQLMQSTLTYPMGAMADRFGRKYLLLFGFSFLICANVIFMTCTSTIGMISGYFLVGLHMSMTHCNLKALISTTIPANMRGSAFSIVGLATGSCLFLGNIMAGQLMDITISHGFGHIGAFIWGFMATCLATFALIFLTWMEGGETSAPQNQANNLKKG